MYACNICVFVECTTGAEGIVISIYVYFLPACLQFCITLKHLDTIYVLPGCTCTHTNTQKNTGMNAHTLKTPECKW